MTDLNRLEKRFCKECESEYIPNHALEKYCSDRCRKDRWRKFAKKKDPYICDGCGKEYIKTVGSRQRFCTLECGEASRARDKFYVFCRDDFKCFYCGRSSFIDGVLLHVDHIYPVKCGGETIMANLVTACERCNLSKNATIFNDAIMVEILEEIERRNVERGINGMKIIKSIER